ncbi:hypothetical protein [Evansella tamaricis]|uniref:Uncharacterized protein n=1 Tax=Evansella tamaricis TaxID=2069301 RepID=A0ABS6JC66_9BACI|nr:hypothetical protein [Evansella tamaricis]MBU9711093.1 hypothetical protein [Evansella tamaricis]
MNNTGLKLIEAIESQTGQTVTINCEKVLYFMDCGDETMVVYEKSNIFIKEKYSEIKSLLNQMI